MWTVKPRRSETEAVMVRGAAWPLFAAIALWPMAAFCQSAPAAQVLFEDGKAAMAGGDYATACAKLADSQSLAPAPGTLFNLALCREKQGRVASAWVTYRDAASAYEAAGRGEWAARAREKVTALYAALPWLTIRAPASPTGVELRRDGVVMVASEVGVAIPVDPGSHRVEASSPGHRSFVREVVIGDRERVNVSVPALEPEVVPIDSVEPAPAAPSPAGATQRTVGVVTASVGVAGIAVGAVAGLMAVGDNRAALRECPREGPCASAAGAEANADARRFATVSTISMAVGGGLAIGGVVLYLTAPRRSGLALRSRGPSLALEGTF